MTGARGGKWEVADVGTTQRGNWKSTISDTGASIDALDYDTNLTHFYAFADGVTDSSGNARHGTAVNSPTYVDGVYGKAVELNGSTQSVTIPYVNLGTTLTYEMWFRTGATTEQTVMCFMKTLVRIVPSTNIIKWFSDIDLGSVNSSAVTINTSTWYHLVITQSGTSYAIYLDGVSAGSGTTNAIDTTDTENAIGVYAASNHFNGYIDHVRIYDDALTADQVKQRYNDCHSGMKATCTVTGSGFTKDIKYTRNAENTAWVADADISNSQTFSTKTLDSTNVLQNTQMHFYNRRFYDWTDLDYLTTGGVGTETIAKGIGHGGNTLTTGASTNDTAFVHYGYDASVAHVPFEVGRKFEVYFLIRNGGGGANKLIQVGLFSSARLGQASFDSTQESISFEYDTDASANWIVRNGSGAAETSTTSSTTAGTDDTLLSIICDESTIKFYADGTLLATHSTNLPTSTTDLFPQVWIKTETTAAQTMYFLRGYGWSDHS